MKIWCCCLCFTREEEDDKEELGEEDKGEAMGDNVFGDKDDPEGRIRNEEEEPEQLGFVGNGRGWDEQLRLFEDDAVAIRGGAEHWEEAARARSLFSWFRISRGSEGEASSASVAGGVEDRGPDYHNKRFKFHSDSQ